jgi:hypothetical protein
MLLCPSLSWNYLSLHPLLCRGHLWKWHYKRGGKWHNLHIYYLHHVRNINSDIDLFYICLCQSNVKFDVETEGKKGNYEKEI